MLMLGQRPLSSSDADAAMFVNRNGELDRLVRVYELGFNALVVGDPGVGVTSLMMQLRRRLSAAGASVKYLDASLVDDVDDFITLMRHPRQEPRAPVTTRGLNLDATILARVVAMERVVTPGNTAWKLAQLGEGVTGRPLVIVDHLREVELVRTLFGRFRDDLWELPFSWIICGRSSFRSEYLRPPADAFFEEELVVPDLDADTARELITRRLQLSGPESEAAIARVLAGLDRIVDRGNPRSLLAGARELALGNDAGDADPVLAASKLGRPAAMLAAELQSLGASSASDDELLRRLGWTRARASQVFGEMEAAGIVIATNERRDGAPGRPRKVYRLSRQEAPR